MIGLSRHDVEGILDTELSMARLDDRDDGLGIDKAKAIARVIAVGIVANNARIKEQLQAAGVVIE